MRALATPIVSAILVVATLTGCGGSTSTDEPATTAAPPAGSGAVVTVAGMAFHPATVTIRAGQSVTWEFSDNAIPHTVTGTGAAATILKSPIFASGTYTQRFDDPGTYPYACTLHPEMTGTVVVTASG